MVGQNSTPDGAAERVFPLPRPESGDDARFTLGLWLDVADVLKRYGYPMDQATGLDHIELQLALFRFLYAPADGGER